ncbi:MAG: hypothetical protein OXU23_07010, partial [Candidatus Poribacteria bacterium]|nr:hypothetical protein [Candidatus Poribacteria bacterium]
VSALPTFLAYVEVPAVFASDWFLRLGDAVRGDLAGGGFFKGIENYAFNFPSAGLTVFEQYMNDGLNDNDTRLHLAAIILGALRVKSAEEKTSKAVVNKWDIELKASPKTELRLCYYRSWRTSFGSGGVSTDELRSVLDIAMKGTIEEQEEAFDVVRRLCLGQIGEEFSCFVLQWLTKHVSPELSPDAKLSVVDMVSRLRDYQGRDKPLIDTAESNKLILGIQPIEKKYTGIWKEVERYLVHRLFENTSCFGELLKQIAEKNPETLIELFRDHEFEHLVSKIDRVGMLQFITDCLFSKSNTIRRLGNILFEQIKVETISDEVVKQISNTELRLALWEFIRKPFFDGEAIAHFLHVLEPLFRNASDRELRNEFEREMILQAMNYPGACIKKWKEVKKPSDLLKRVIAKVDGYFEDLKKVDNSPANSFQFPNFLEAAERGSRDLSHRISKGARDRSLISQLLTRVDLIYGDNVCVLGQGEQNGPGDPFPMNRFSHQMELPRLEVLMPEIMAQRRMIAAENIRRLQTEEMENAK